MFFFELHEGDADIYSDVLVVSESEWEPQEFFDLVQRIRRDVQDGYHLDTLSEAIAIVLERDHGFIHVSDDRLSAAVNVSVVEEENFLTELEVEIADRDEDEDEDDDDDELVARRARGGVAAPDASADYRSILADLELDGGGPH